MWLLIDIHFLITLRQRRPLFVKAASVQFIDEGVDDLAFREQTALEHLPVAPSGLRLGSHWARTLDGKAG